MNQHAADPSRRPSAAAAIDTLKLDDQKWADLTRRVREAAAQGQNPAEKRHHERKRYEKRIRCILRAQQPGAKEPQNFIVYSRNLSRGGLGFFHGAYVHPRTVCQVILPRPDGKGAVIDARVQWCRHVEQRIHEVGVQFDEPIEIDAFLDGDEPEV